MTRRLLTIAGVLVLVFLVTWGVSSFALDPENLGGRLGLYVLGILAILAAIVLLIVALVKRARARA
jgi:uncharacterized membrane protein